MTQSTITTEVSKIILPTYNMSTKEILLSLFLELTQAVDFLIPNKTYYSRIIPPRLTTRLHTVCAWGNRTLLTPLESNKLSRTQIRPRK